jgi:hypothetical protein
VECVLCCRPGLFHRSRIVLLIAVAGLESSLSSRRGLSGLARDGKIDKTSSIFSQAVKSYIGWRSRE